MRVAVPVMKDKLSRHFGKSDRFLVFEVDENSRRVVSQESVFCDQEACHGLPAWVAKSLKVDVLLVGGIGMPAKRGLERMGVEVEFAIDDDDIENVIQSFMDDPEAGNASTCWGHEHCKTEDCGHD